MRFASSDSRQRLGRQSEELARRFLAAQGYRIDAANVRFPVGELDVVGREGRTLCFIEVRAVTSDRWGGAAATVNARKQRRVIQAARWYLAHHPVPAAEIRFDVLAIDWSDGVTPAIQLIRGAFDVGSAGLNL